ncbi:hypothetical protein [Streptomyces lavenduligriseus]|uniref:Uncharacterized protein n=1 Tax=Streptomyces lavenduligriseus TaxID=67315 RepID=A0ABT0P357_9ACTN|nr:hypothetical protein [Streptomyces lavenduligriseus]MCL3998164.1 hypothetical protein [Streptomyces lavenduligriseus]
MSEQINMFSLASPTITVLQVVLPALIGLTVAAVGRWNLHIDRNHIEITTRPRPKCPCCHGSRRWRPAAAGLTAARYASRSDPPAASSPGRNEPPF